MPPIDSILSKLRETNKTRVILQAPEGLLRTARAMLPTLIDAGYDVTLSGDPCYGACDLVAHLEDDVVLVHLGHAPVDQRQNVIYEICPLDFDPKVILSVIPLLTAKRIGLVTTVQHVHMLASVQKLLAKEGYTPVIGSPTPRTPYAGQVLGCSFGGACTDADEIVYIGTGVFHAIGVHLATKVRVLALDPFMKTCEEINVRSFLKKRFSLIERAKNADQYGIIISTKPGQRRIERAQELLNLHSQAVPVWMREVSADQLLNMGFPCYVNTACPRLAYDDQPRFSVPVISPQEFEIVCGTRSWDEYAIDEIV
jgi:2-(3-amino-3-carboxypropyl)histidine synthase